MYISLNNEVPEDDIERIDSCFIELDHSRIGFFSNFINIAMKSTNYAAILATLFSIVIAQTAVAAVDFTLVDQNGGDGSIVWNHDWTFGE
jgi:hypothetical protein